jgi:hypothetical protein
MEDGLGFVFWYRLPRQINSQLHRAPCVIELICTSADLIYLYRLKRNDIFDRRDDEIHL